MGVNGKIVKCGFAWKCLIVEQSGWNLGPGDLIMLMTTCAFRVRSLEFSLESFGAFWTFNEGGNGKILKRATSWNWLIVERNGWKVGTRVLESAYVVLFFEFNLGSFGAQAITFLNNYGISKTYTVWPWGAGNVKMLPLLQLSSDLSQTLWGYWLPWWNRGYYFSWNWPSFFLQNVALWINMGVDVKMLKCAMLENGWS